LGFRGANWLTNGMSFVQLRIARGANQWQTESAQGEASKCKRQSRTPATAAVQVTQQKARTSIQPPRDCCHTQGSKLQPALPCVTQLPETVAMLWPPPSTTTTRSITATLQPHTLLPAHPDRCHHHKDVAATAMSHDPSVCRTHLLGPGEHLVVARRMAMMPFQGAGISGKSNLHRQVPVFMKPYTLTA